MTEQDLFSEVEKATDVRQAEVLMKVFEKRSEACDHQRLWGLYQNGWRKKYRNRNRLENYFCDKNNEQKELQSLFARALATSPCLKCSACVDRINRGKGALLICRPV